jgi:hypothetical protein
MLALAMPLSLALGNFLGSAVTDAKWQAAEAELSEISGFAQSLVGADEVAAPVTGFVLTMANSSFCRIRCRVLPR